MKPIKLKIQGLNSFIQETEINFEVLTQYGLFGIFGNVGCGKSTILDAITLALYGVIPRNTKHFINLKSDKAIVNFEFSIRDRATQERIIYKVERTFAPNNLGYANTKSAGIYDITDPDDVKVLGTGANDVNARCLEIINLGVNDFFRTVVIPQGQFSAFLELKNQPRRVMLEKLFGLEEFGDVLESKIKFRLNKVSNEITVINRILTDIKVLTDDEYDQLKLDLGNMDQVLKSKKDEYDTAYKRYESIKNNLDLQKKEAEIKANIETCETQRDTINQLREKIALSQKAKAVNPLIINKNKLNADYDTASIKLTNSIKNLKDLESKQTAIIDSFNKAEGDKNTKIPELIEQKTKLEQALSDENSLKALDKLIGDIKASITELEAEKDKLKVELDKHTNEESKLKTLQADLAKQINDNSITTDYKVNVTKGAELVKDLKSLKAELKKQQSAQDKIKENINTLNDALITLNQSETNLNNQIGSLSISKVDEDDVKNLKDLQQSLETNKDLHQQNELNKSISSLKDVCHIGEACPVCGKDLDCLPAFCDDDGVDYKKVIGDIEAKIKDLEESMKKKELDKITEIGQLKATLAVAKTNIDNSKTTIKSEEDKLEVLTTEIVEIETKINDKSNELDQVKSDTKVTDFGKMLKEILAKEKAKEALEPQLAKAQNDIVNNNKEILSSTNTLSDIDANMGKLNGQLKAELSRKNDITDKLKNDFGDDFDITSKLAIVNQEINTIETIYTKSKKSKESFEADQKVKVNDKTSAETEVNTLKTQIDTAISDLSVKLKENDFDNENQVTDALLEDKISSEITTQVENFDTTFNKLLGTLNDTQNTLNGVYKTEDELLASEEAKTTSEKDLDETTKSKINKSNEYVNAKNNMVKFNKEMISLNKLKHEQALVKDLYDTVGSKKLVGYVATERLKRICFTASKYLMEMTDNQYELRTDDEANFIIKNGTYERPVSTLSGGQMFITSLALALALSTEIQKKAGTKMELFFLDEGFGSLDEALAEKVMDTIAKIPNEDMKVGIISHIESIKDRVPVKLLVEAPTNHKGSAVTIA